MTPGPGSRFGPYVLGRVLGRGGMAVVHEATHESTGRVVALKLIRPEHAGPDFADRLRREGRAQAALDHPNVVTIYEAGTSEHGPWLAMRLVDGTTLSDLIDAGTLDAASALDILDQVAAALDAAHAAGLVHRDVKPRNVLVSEDGTAYLADFGLSRPSAGDGATVTGHFMGTLAYAAPEVLRGEEPGPAADRYALAAVLFECLTGSTVFPRPSHAAVVFAHTNEPAPRVSGRRAGIPPALDAAVIEGLAKDPRDRPATARALIGRARAALRGTCSGRRRRRSAVPPEDDATTGATLPMGAPAPADRGTRGRRAAVLAVTALIAAVAGGRGRRLDGGDGPGPAAAAELPPPPRAPGRWAATSRARAARWTAGAPHRPAHRPPAPSSRTATPG
ncbi:MAG: serine/threonine-protein kinase [Thermoleophilia bacterium]